MEHLNQINRSLTETTSLYNKTRVKSTERGKLRSLIGVTLYFLSTNLLKYHDYRQTLQTTILNQDYHKTYKFLLPCSRSCTEYEA